MKAFVNILIQLFWLALCLFLAYLIASALFDKMAWRCLSTGIFSVTIYFFIYWIQESIKAVKDPDVQTAADLRMSISRFRLYKRLWYEYQEYMEVHGTNSKESNEKFKEIFKQIPNPNEWRRFGDYMVEKQHEDMMNEIYKYRE